MGKIHGIADRLKRMKEAGQLPGSPVNPEITEHVHILDSADWKKIGSFTYRRTSAYPCELPSVFENSVLVAPGTPADNLLFLDIETTGLSAGAGSITFLVGIGRGEGDKFTVTQYFLSDYPGEREFLEILKSVLSPDAVYVSYNGKCFDTQILRTRFIMNRLAIHFERQIDLLFPVRRLWRSLIGSCSLSNVEEAVLNIQRDGDIPGALVPEYYFQFLKTGKIELMSKVFFHHLQDILTLSTLLKHMEKILREPFDHNVDNLQLGKWLITLNRPEGAELLEREFKRGDIKAGAFLGAMWKRAELWDKALKIWSRLWQDHADPFGAIELAKYYEHKAKDFCKALSIIEALQSKRSDESDALIVEARPDRITHRIDRINMKLAKVRA